MAEDEIVRWHHQLNGREFEQTLGVGDGQRSLVCCSPWCHKESDTTERLKLTEQKNNYLGAFLYSFHPTNGNKTKHIFFW